MILLDANILVYSINERAPQNTPAVHLIVAAQERRFPAVLVPQTILEFIATVTNPRRVSDPLSFAAVRETIDLLLDKVPVLPVESSALSRLADLLDSYPRTGSRIYDLFLVAQMQTHGISQICTYNVRDFSGLPGIEALTPDHVLAALS